MKTTKLFQLGLVSALSVSALTMSSSAFEDRIECGMPLDVWESTQNFVPEGFVYEYIVDENGYYTLVDENGNPLPLDEEMTVTHVPWGSPGMEGSMVPALYDTIIFEEGHYILGADGSFDGVLTEELQSLGVTSLEEVYNTGDYAMYIATTSEEAGNIMEELESLNLFLSVERTAEGVLYSPAPTIDCDLSHLFDEDGIYIFDENDQIPEGIPYEYVMDEEGNFVLIGEEASYTTSTSTSSSTSEESESEGFLVYMIDSEGNEILVDEAPELTEVFDPEGAPMPEGAFASPVSVEVSGGNWFTGFLSSIFQFFFA